MNDPLDLAWSEKKQKNREKKKKKENRSIHNLQKEMECFKRIQTNLRPRLTTSVSCKLQCK